MNILDAELPPDATSDVLIDRQNDEEPLETVQQLLAGLPLTMDLGLVAAIRKKHRNPAFARGLAAAALKYDFLLSLTKHVIPLLSLVATGQIFNGLFSSMILSYVLRNWVPGNFLKTIMLLGNLRDDGYFENACLVDKYARGCVYSCVY